MGTAASIRRTGGGWQRSIFRVRAVGDGRAGVYANAMHRARSQREPAWLRALGDADLPESLTLPDGSYRHIRTYKHDFFAATGLYEGPGGRVILKVGRQYPLGLLPMRWLGRLLTRRELAMLLALEGVEGIPRCLGPFNDTGLVRVFVEGHPLQPQERLDDGFFARLERLVSSLHDRGLAYVDLEKRENVLVGGDSRPWLIDFQISWRWTGSPKTDSGVLAHFLPDVLGRWVLRKFQAADRYHLLKHWRRHRPDQLTREQLAASRRQGFWVKMHRLVFRPVTVGRRAVLKRLTGRSRSPKQDGPEFVGPPR